MFCGQNSDCVFLWRSSYLWCDILKMLLNTDKRWKNRRPKKSTDLHQFNRVFIPIEFDCSVKRPPPNYHHLTITTTILRSHFKLFFHKWPLKNDHLSTETTIFGFQGCTKFWVYFVFDQKCFEHFFSTLTKIWSIPIKELL